MAAGQVVRDNASNVQGLISSHGARKEENQSISKENARASVRSKAINANTGAVCNSAGDKEGGASTTKKACFDDINDMTLVNILESERFKHIRVHKNQLTITPSPPDHIQLFRTQEAERYKYPDRPWVYFNGDGSTSIVAPVIKKKN